MVEIRECTVAEIQAAPNIEALLEAYGEEAALDGIGEPKADMNGYERLEALGLIKCIGAFDGKFIVGLYIILFTPLPHYEGVTVAVTNSWFVLPEHRASGAGLLLLGAAEGLVQNSNAVGLFIQAKIGSKLEKVMEKTLDYTETTRAWFKALK